MLAWGPPKRSLRRGRRAESASARREAADGAARSRRAAAPFSLRARPRGRSAAVEIWWSNWCGPGSREASGPFTPPTGVEVTLPTRGTVRLKVAHAPRCDQPKEPSRVAVRPFKPLLPQPRPSTHLPFRLRFDRTVYRVEIGHSLHYRITVTNTAHRPFRFDRCPVYFEQLGGAVSHEVHYLNCRPAGTLIPGADGVFAIKLHVRPSTKRGRYGLLFELGLGTYEPVQAAAPLVWVKR